MRKSRLHAESFLLKGFLALALTFATGGEALAQIKLTTQKAKLETVIEKIKKQSKYRFFYSDALAKTSVNGINVSNGSINEVLDKLFTGTSITYRVAGDVVYLSDRNAPEVKKEQKTNQQNNKDGQQHTVKGVVKDALGEPLIGVSVQVKGTGKGAITNIDGEYTLTTDVANPVLVYSYVGYAQQEISVNSRGVIDVVMKDDSKVLGEVVVTAMGIRRNEKSLTYATQKVKAEDLTRVQDPNVANTLEGKISGVTITPSAGGAGGASKIILRGNKSILGNNSPLIVVDGVPMTNNTRGQASELLYSGVSEGGDPLSMINPDDIETINVLKGANAAALYGAAAANGVVMITTKKGKEGKMLLSVSSNVTFDNPLLTPKLQRVYGAQVIPNQGVSIGAWGERIDSRPNSDLMPNVPINNDLFPGQNHDLHLRNVARDDVKDFFRTGITTNNSVSVSGGTEKIQTYFSFANSHANGMVDRNSYNRNTLSFRQTYNLFKRLRVEASVNYALTKTQNRPGGGTLLNPIYHLYTTPGNIDMQWYRDNYSVDNASWIAKGQALYSQLANGDFRWLTGQRVTLNGTRQNWAYMQGGQNNPYWLTRMNTSVQKNNRVYGYLSGKVDIVDGLDFQARVSIDHTNFESESKRYATTLAPVDFYPYGSYYRTMERTEEIYTDYLLSYNKTFKEDWNVSATAGWVAHVIRTKGMSVNASNATYISPTRQQMPTRINWFDTRAGDLHGTSPSQSTNWDKAALFTAQLGWKDKVFVDGSYRQDWYRAFRQFADRGLSESYGYFGFGANAIVSSLVKLPQPISYLKYRISYSEVGNSIPNIFFSKGSENLETGAVSPSPYNYFRNPIPEKSKSFETGIEASFFDSRLDLDLTYYRALSTNQYMIATFADGRTTPINSAKTRNSGIEATVGYNFKFGKDFTWRTALNFSYNDNKILKTAYNEDGKEALIANEVGGVRVRYREGGRMGDMYITDYRYAPDGSLDTQGFFRANGDGTFTAYRYRTDASGNIAVGADGKPIEELYTRNNLSRLGTLKRETSNDKLYGRYVGNMNSKIQLGWSNTFTYKGATLSFLINGRIGGKVISLTEGYLDNLGLSQRSADARMYAEANGLVHRGMPLMYLPDGSGRLVPIRRYYESVGGSRNPAEYIYDATNFRMRELSLGYNFRNLLGAGRNLNLSFIARNLFFLYKKSPVDPDVSLSTNNGMSAFEVFNMPSSRSYGFSLKLDL